MWKPTEPEGDAISPPRSHSWKAGRQKIQTQVHYQPQHRTASYRTRSFIYRWAQLPATLKCMLQSANQFWFLPYLKLYFFPFLALAGMFFLTVDTTKCLFLQEAFQNCKVQVISSPSRTCNSVLNIAITPITSHTCVHVFGTVR